MADTVKTNDAYLEPFKEPLEALLSAARDGHLALVHCTRVTGGDIPVMCSVTKDGKEYVFRPLGVLLDEESLADILPPNSALKK